MGFGGAIRTDFIEGMGKSNEDFIIILNIDSVLSMEDIRILIESDVAPEQALEDKDVAVEDNQVAANSEN